MSFATLPSEIIRALRATLRVQLVVAAIAAVLTAAVSWAVIDGHAPVVALGLWWLAALVLIQASARAVAAPGAAPWQSLTQLGPRIVAQQLALAAPTLALVALARTVSGGQPLIAVALVPIVFVVAALTLAPMQLAFGAGAFERGAWLPTAVVQQVRPVKWRAAGCALTAGVLLGLVVLPGALAGLILTALLGPFGVLGYGIAAAIWIPLTGTASAQAWRQLTDAADVEPAAGAEAEVLGAAPAGWTVGPTWQAAFDGDGRWGAWVQMSVAGAVAVQVASAMHLPPNGMSLLTHGVDGVWVDHGGAGATGQPPVLVQLGVGASWIQLQVTPGVPMPAGFDVALLVPAQASAA